MHRLEEEEEDLEDIDASESQRPFDFASEQSPAASFRAVEDEEQPFDFQFDAAEIEISSAVGSEYEHEANAADSQSVESHISASSHSSDGSFDEDNEVDLEENESPSEILSVPSDEGEEEEGNEDELDIFSDIDDEEEDEEEESLPQAEKGVAFLQSLFLADLPEDDDDESSFPEEIDLEYEQNRSPLGSALDALEDFAAESIYSASLLFMGPAELEERRMLKKMSSKKSIVKDEKGEQKDEILSV
ncbi:MAG: hypothetical protein SGARI_003592 [Bacillariaceae sp.]